MTRGSGTCQRHCYAPALDLSATFITFGCRTIDRCPAKLNQQGVEKAQLGLKYLRTPTAEWYVVTRKNPEIQAAAS
jgi:hypothetical protein